MADWLQSREQRSEKKAAKSAAGPDQAPEDSPARAQAQLRQQEKRQDKRESNVEAGLDVLDTWLADLARDGLAGLRAKPAKDWDGMAARLVDTQAPGLAGRLRRAGMRIYGSAAPGWEAGVARELARIALLSHSYRRLAALPEPLRHDVKTAIGWVASQDDALATPGVDDVWLVCGNHTQDDERIARRSCHLRGQRSGRRAVLLQFSAGSQALPPPLLPGTRHRGTLHFYPGALPLRAVFASHPTLPATPAALSDTATPALPDAATAQALPPAALALPPAAMASAEAAPGLSALLAEYTRALAVQPFIDAYPMQLEQVVPHVFAAPVQAQPHFVLRAADGASVPLDPAFRHGWHLLALAGGHPAGVFGLWHGDTFLPLAARIGDRLHDLDGGSAPGAVQ